MGWRLHINPAVRNKQSGLPHGPFHLRLDRARVKASPVARFAVPTRAPAAAPRACAQKGDGMGDVHGGLHLWLTRA